MAAGGGYKLKATLGGGEMTFPRIWGLNPPQLHRAELGDEMGLAWGGRTLRTPVCWDGGGRAHSSPIQSTSQVQS